MFNFHAYTNTLFLDRDGVINIENPHGYILNWNEFVFCEGAIEAIRMLSKHFQHLVVVTNQRGVGKGLMSEKDLHHIHQKMEKEIVAQGGRIDGVWFCSAMEENAFCRKPNIGMAFQAKEKIPSIDFSQSVMVGNSASDMLFGKNVGLQNVFIGNKKLCQEDQLYVHQYCESLLALAKLFLQ